MASREDAFETKGFVPPYSTIRLARAPLRPAGCFSLGVATDCLQVESAPLDPAPLLAMTLQPLAALLCARSHVGEVSACLVSQLSAKLLSARGPVSVTSAALLELASLLGREEVAPVAPQAVHALLVLLQDDCASDGTRAAALRALGALLAFAAGPELCAAVILDAAALALRLFSDATCHLRDPATVAACHVLLARLAGLGDTVDQVCPAAVAAACLSLAVRAGAPREASAACDSLAAFARERPAAFGAHATPALAALVNGLSNPSRSVRSAASRALPVCLRAALRDEAAASAACTEARGLARMLARMARQTGGE